MKIPIRRWNPTAVLPKVATHGDAGSDCYINGFKEIDYTQKKKLKELKDKEYTLKPLERILCPLGFATAIPEGYYAAVVPRSGLALWEGLSIVNSPGTIDAGYRNEWGAIVVNLSNRDVVLHKGDKICQEMWFCIRVIKFVNSSFGNLWNMILKLLRNFQPLIAV